MESEENGNDFIHNVKTNVSLKMWLILLIPQ